MRVEVVAEQERRVARPGARTAAGARSGAGSPRRSSPARAAYRSSASGEKTGSSSRSPSGRSASAQSGLSAAASSAIVSHGCGRYGQLARSFVQYETTMSAPARLIAVSDSSAACRSSSQPRAAGRLDHRVLAGDVVGGERQVEALARGPDHVEVRKRRLDHDHVGALGDVQLALAQRLADVRRIHLVAAPVAERRRRVGRLAERAVERRGVLGRVGDDRRLSASASSASGSRRRGRPSCRSGRRRRRRPRRG